MDFHDYLLKQSEPILKEIYQSPFVKGIGFDNLSQQQRDYYVAQDTYYTDMFSHLFDLTTDKLTSRQQADQPQSLDESLAHDALLASPNMLNIPPDDHNLAYLNHMKTAITNGDATNAMLALLPCTESYHFIGKHYLKTTQHNTYLPWLEYYSSPAYQAFTQWSWQVVDAQNPNWQNLASDIKKQYLHTYLTSYQYELSFWEHAAQQ
ncbi:TenA family protein [Weissella bombi]|uniref:Aminopyrimidine aminohydrolase n=1 Tax=Weissella bombi TaxID=1505725 RepID=A0A1C3YXI0_9LACO|nr:TenA family protein [Weissella bombi]SCB74824.1 thiaminase (transcriptional activator TenA) [Weissella bombi]